MTPDEKKYLELFEANQDLKLARMELLFQKIKEQNYDIQQKFILMQELFKKSLVLQEIVLKEKAWFIFKLKIKHWFKKN